MRQQRRGRVIAMNAEELTSFLGEQRTCRFATTGPDPDRAVAELEY